MSDTKWLSVKETAESLGVAAATVYAMADKNLIAHYRVGTGRGRLMFKPADVESYLESKRSGPAIKKKPVLVPRPALPVVVEDHLGNHRARARRRP